MLKKILQRFSGAAVFILMMSMVQVGMASISKGTSASAPNAKPKDLQDRVLHALLMLPTYGVFDDIKFALKGDTVTLTGEVRKPILKSEAEATVRKLPGVTHVINNVEILPLSPIDDSLRAATYRAVYSQPGFERYDIQAFKPIKIIVKNSNITLDGVVGTQIDKILAGEAARRVPFAFSVTNNLTID
ncbi:MAG TPA: BON domain-containing protein [Acidobacteriota bacterium]|nr:BON domain-containing protein [Acidobacteriota bacterium]